MKLLGNENSAPLEGQNALRVKVGELLGWPARLTLWRFRYAAASDPITCGGWATKEVAESEMTKLRKQGFGVDDKPKSYETDNPELPDYPNDLNACAELIDFLADNGWRFELMNGLFTAMIPNKWRAAFIYNGVGGSKEHAVWDKTPATAISRAFVTTMEGKGK